MQFVGGKRKVVNYECNFFSGEVLVNGTLSGEQLHGILLDEYTPGVFLSLGNKYIDNNDH